MLKKILVIIILIILVIFLAKDYLAKEALSHFFNKKLKLKSEIGECRISFKGLNLEKVNISAEGFILEIPHLEASLNFSRYFFPKGLDIVAKGPSLVIDDFKAVQDKFSPSKATLKAKSSKPDEFMLKLNLQNIDFSLEDKDIDFKGIFLGEVVLGLGSGGFGQIEGTLVSIGAGDINIRKDTSLSALKKYLDKPSYDTLLNSFKNYSYNWGRITIAKSQGGISVSLDFDSPQSGKRNINFNLHRD